MSVSKKSKNTHVITSRWEFHESPSFIWSVFAVLGEEILLEKKVIAGNEEDAKFKAGVYDILKEKGRKPSEVIIKLGVIFTLKGEK